MDKDYNKNKPNIAKYGYSSEIGIQKKTPKSDSVSNPPRSSRFKPRVKTGGVQFQTLQIPDPKFSTFRHDTDGAGQHTGGVIDPETGAPIPTAALGTYLT